MPVSATMTCTDIAAFSAVFRSPNCEFTAESPDRFAARYSVLDLNRVGMLRVSENLARFAHFEIPRTHVAISFQACPGSPIRISGAELGPTQIGVHAPGECVFQRVSGPATWGSVFLSADALLDLGASAASLEFLLSPGALVTTAPPVVLDRLRRLHAELATLADTAPAAIANPRTARGLEAALAERLLDCVETTGRSDASSTRYRHSLTLRRLLDLAQAYGDRPLFMLDVCGTLGISRRRLQEICNEFLGMGPKRFLLLRRMRLVHLALRRADPAEASVTEIAMHYGFWELGRFAVAYRTLYGEPPSQSLRRPAGRGSRRLH
jgi:AraC-like DNA-binding protein